ncbi:MAG: pilus assembly protein PilC [Syntrophobacteraceae bacterium CG2_30_61_12]|nr:MAG: pilus assembly protein PilC [Syntrophobacteraceae bacterium CG2_30_61_12]
MPIFIWQGTDRKGARAKGEIESDNIVIARELLLRQGVTIRRLKPKPRDLLDYLPFLQGRVKERDLVIFVRQLATMIDAGVPIVQCLEVLREQSENKTFKVVLKDVTKEVEAGATLHESLEKHPKVFDNLFCNLTAAGEAGGILDVILNRLANYIEKTAKLKKRIRGAMTYPGVVVSVAISVVIVILLYVIPVFAGLFKDAGAPLPPLTMVVISLSDFVKNFFHWIVLSVILLVFLGRWIRRTEQGRYQSDRLLLRLPVFGILLRKVAVARFSRTLGTMLASGIPILDALNIVAATAGNKVVEKAIRSARVSIAQGNSIAEPLLATKVFPLMVVHMISVGENSGALDAMLEKVADFYDEEVDVAVDSMTSLLEPMLIVFLGVTIGALLVAMYLPIFQLGDVVSRGV